MTVKPMDTFVDTRARWRSWLKFWDINRKQEAHPIAYGSARYILSIAFLFFLFHLFQIDHYAQRDLKKGLQLFGTEGNVGLTNAWMIVQTDVSI